MAVGQCTSCVLVNVTHRDITVTSFPDGRHAAAPTHRNQQIAMLSRLIRVERFLDHVNRVLGCKGHMEYM